MKVPINIIILIKAFNKAFNNIFNIAIINTFNLT